MLNLETINNMTRDELENFRNETLISLGLEGNQLPYMVLAALKSTPVVTPVSNAMFNILLHYYTTITRDFNRFGSTTEWLEDELIKGWTCIPYNSTNYVFFLNSQQYEVLCRVMDEARQLLSTGVSIDFDTIHTDELAVDSLSETEKHHPLAVPYIIPANSASLTVAENTSRFSGATWFEAIQHKTIILAGLGGIGSYVCFLLSRVQPASIFIYDDDIVEFANMSGQLYGRNDIGKFKVDAITDMVSIYANFNSVFAIREKFTSSCEPTDIMICGFDNMSARRIFFEKWREHVNSKTLPDKRKCLFIDGRLSAEYLQVYCFTGDDMQSINNYYETALFSDAEADETVCSYKQTTYMANMIGSIIVNLFTNFVANEVANAPIRELPYLTSYDGNSMQLKIE